MSWPFYILVMPRSPALDGDTSTWVGKASFDLPNTKVETWTRFSVPFNYYSDKTPQYILIILTSGNGTKAKAGSSAKFDDLDVIFNNTTGIKNYQKGTLNVFAYNQKLRINLVNTPRGIYKVRVLNILGRIQYSTTLQSGENKVINLLLPTGIYLVQAQCGENVLVKKILIH